MTSPALGPFKIYGPFEVPKGEFGPKRAALGAETAGYPDLIYAWGVYVIGVRHGASYRIKYIGKTAAQWGFWFEIFATGSHKQGIMARNRSAFGDTRDLAAGQVKTWSARLLLRQKDGLLRRAD